MGSVGLSFRFDVQAGSVFNKLRQMLLPAFLGSNVSIHAPFHIVIPLLGDTKVGGTVIIIE